MLEEKVTKATEEMKTKELSRRNFVKGAMVAGAAAAGGLLNAAPALAGTGDVTLKVNGAKVAADVAPFVKDGRTMVPIRFVAEALQTEVGWDAATKTATVDAKELTFAYKKLDPEKARQAGYEAYYAGGSCMYGGAYGLLKNLREEVGFPWTTLPANAFWYGLGGALEGSLCGAVNGAMAIMGMILGKGDTMKALMGELNKWYKESELPLDDKHKAWSKYTTVTTVSTTVNCSDSRGIWMEKTGFKVADPERADRCAKVTGDVCAKVAELLNKQFGY